MEDASSWDRWVTLFEDAGYMGAPGWPGDPETVATAASPCATPRTGTARSDSAASSSATASRTKSARTR